MNIFKFIFVFIFMILNFLLLTVEAKPLQANVSKQGELGRHRIVDANTNLPIKGAKVTLPKNSFSTVTNEDGVFDLRADISGETLMSIEKSGYKPFSLTVNERIAARPMIVGIEKTGPMDIVVDTGIFHLGDNNYSDMSANASEFKVKSIGPYYTKNVKIDYAGNNTYLVIGSILGIDTKLAKSMGQNRISFAYASPTEVFFNGNKIAEIDLNGDGQKIKLPRQLIRQNQENEITIKTGRNLMQNDYIDYDDIEIMNLYIESR